MKITDADKLAKLSGELSDRLELYAAISNNILSVRAEGSKKELQLSPGAAAAVRGDLCSFCRAQCRETYAKIQSLGVHDEQLENLHKFLIPDGEPHAD